MIMYGLGNSIAVLIPIVLQGLLVGYWFNLGICSSLRQNKVTQLSTFSDKTNTTTII